MLSSAASRGLINSPSTSYVTECRPHIESCSTNNRNAVNEPAIIAEIMHDVDGLPSAVHANDDENVDVDDDQYLSQYEIDIVNKYLNELGNADENIECDDPSDGDGTIAVNSDGGIALAHTSDDESEQRSVIEVIDSDASSNAMAATITDAGAGQASAAQVSAGQASATQTSRRSIDPANANNADVNNNNTSLIGIASNPYDGQQDRGVGQRFCEPNRRTNTSANANMNLPMIVGITSCVWGLCLYAMKSIYSDLT